ncbi:MAG: DUF1700 domain-containing protein [Pseudomonadota bacterium]
MSKLEFLDALKRAMAGLPPETMAKTLAYYEQRFVDGAAAGLSEAEIHASLDDPKKIAMTLRASAHMNAFEKQRNPANLVRMVVSGVGLAIFNLFMVVPAIVYTALLTAMYACALAFYVSGIAITASGLSGANELVLDGPLRHFVVDGESFNDSADSQTKVSISEAGIRVFQEQLERDDKDEDADSGKASPVIRRAEAVAGRGIHITTDMDSASRTTQSLFGLGMVLAGIMLFLLSLVVTKYTLVGVKRYIDMNFSLLKGS